MNVLLLQPKFLTTEVAFPLGLAYLASSLEKAHHNAFGLDCAFQDFDTIKALIKERNIKLIAISCHSYNYANAIFLSKKLKSSFKLPIVFGGPHCTISPESLIKEKGIDFVITGEGENVMVELANSIEQNKSFFDILSLVYKDKDGNVHKNNLRPQEENLSEFPFPNRDIFPAKSYYGSNSKNSHYAPILTSRGCIHMCTYCPTNKLWKKWRPRPARDVVDEMETILVHNKIREFHIEDDNFMIDPSRVSSICDEIIRRDLNIDWQCTNGIYPEDLPPSILEKMAKSGCYRIALGIESFNKGLLEKFNRKINIKKITDIITTANKYSIEAVGYFILGLPGETLDSIKTTIKLSKKLGLHLAHYSIFHIIPGSELLEKVKHRFSYEEIINNKISLCSVPIENLKILKRNAYILLCLNSKTYFYIFKSLKLTKNIRNILAKMKNLLSI